jgi:glycosyltransferase involved in cell wall biosynthesis
LIKVSVIIPFFNRVDLLKRAIASVQQQLYKPFELIIIDDCSRESYDKNEFPSSIIWLRNKLNIGPGFSRNEGLKIASGAFVAFLDSDDFWNKEFLTETIQLLQSNPQLPFVYTKGRSDKIFLDEPDFWLSKVPSEIILPTIIKRNRPWGTSGMLWRKECLQSVGGFKFSRNYEDYELEARIAANGWNRVAYIDKVLLTYDVTSQEKVSLTYRFSDETAPEKVDVFISIFKSSIKCCEDYYYTALLYLTRLALQLVRHKMESELKKFENLNEFKALDLKIYKFFSSNYFLPFWARMFIMKIYLRYVIIRSNISYS